MNRKIVMTGVLFGTLAVILGAFGAHGLENRIDAESLRTWETGVKYQMFHALLLLLVAGLPKLRETQKKGIFYCLFVGIILFSFSIYFLATNTLTSFDFKAIGFITPLGGLLLIGGWVLLGVAYWKSTKSRGSAT